jgi:hypothetical protein
VAIAAGGVVPGVVVLILRGGKHEDRMVGFTYQAWSTCPQQQRGDMVNMVERCLRKGNQSKCEVSESLDESSKFVALVAVVTVVSV